MSLLQKTKKITPLAAPSIAPIADPEEFPVPVFQFSIDINGVIVALFQSISGMSVSRNVESVTVGGQNDTENEFPGQVSYGHVTFNSGLSSSDFFYKWMMHGAEDGSVLKMNFTLQQRRSVTTGYETVKTWNFENAYPVKWSISELTVDDSDNIVIESLELSFDRFVLGT